MTATPAAAGFSHYRTKVLLVDDSPMIGEAVRRMLASQADIEFHYCSDPIEAMQRANEIEPTVILQDLVMPEVDGLTLVKFYRANPTTRDTPLIVLSGNEKGVTKAEAFSVGANDYLVKPPEEVELIARIRYHSQGYIRLLERNEAYAALDASRAHLAEQIDAASRYLFSLLPAATSEPVTLDWRYVPCADLGGDTFGYHLLDDDHLAIYLIDVTGHGLDSALFSVTIMNVLRSQSLAGADFAQPGQVLTALNAAFPMEKYGDKCFTIWYGVWNLVTRQLSYSGGGHPDSLLFPGGQPAGSLPIRLESTGPMMGMMPWDEFDTGSVDVPPGSRLYVYSDGAQEIHRPDGTDWSIPEFLHFMSQPDDGRESLMDRLYRYCKELHGSPILDDDFSMIEGRF